MTAVHSNIQPVFFSGKETDAEILVIQAKLGNYNCRFINAYGPQEYYYSLLYVHKLMVQLEDD